MTEFETALAFEAFGARIGIEAPRAVARLVRPRLPPTATPIRPEELDAIYRIVPTPGTGRSDEPLYGLSCAGGLATQAARLLGEPQHRLIYLCEKGVVVPDFQDAEGRGSSRRFSARNLLEFAVALQLRRPGQRSR